MNQRVRERSRQRLESVIRRLDAYYAAEEAILGGAQEYSVGTRRLRRGDLNAVREEIEKLEQQRDDLECAVELGNGGRKSYRVIYRDL